MKSVRVAPFRKLLEGLTKEVQADAAQAFADFCADPALVHFEFKGWLNQKRLYGAHVNYGYRAIARVDGDTACWFWIGTHGDYDRILSKVGK